MVNCHVVRKIVLDLGIFLLAFGSVENPGGAFPLNSRPLGAGVCHRKSVSWRVSSAEKGSWTAGCNDERTRNEIGIRAVTPNLCRFRGGAGAWGGMNERARGLGRYGEEKDWVVQHIAFLVPPRTPPVDVPLI